MFCTFNQITKAKGVLDIKKAYDIIKYKSFNNIALFINNRFLAVI